MSNKPVPSDSIEDLKLNVLVEDVVVTSKDKEHTPNRLGVEILTLHGMEKRHDRLMAGQNQSFDSFIASSQGQFIRFLESSGFSGADRQYAPGIVLSGHNEGFVRCEPDGTACLFYTPRGDTPLPYTTTGDWAAESSLFVVRGDDALRQDLQRDSIGNTGSSIVGFLQRGSNSIGRTLQSKGEDLISFADFGGKLDGSDESQILNKAITDIASMGGGKITIPFIGTGLLRIYSQIKLAENVWVDIDPSVRIDYTNVTEADAFSARGEMLGAEVELSDVVNLGEVVVKTKTPHGLDVGDWALLKSQRACLHDDAGPRWRLGETTAGTQTPFFAEPVCVLSVDSPTQITLSAGTLFPDYRPDNSQETYPGARASSTIQKIGFLKGAKLTGGRYFKTGGTANCYRGILAYEALFSPSNVDLGRMRGAAAILQSCFRSNAYGPATRPVDWDKGEVDRSAFNSWKDIGSWYCHMGVEDYNGSQGYDQSFVNGGHPSIEPSLDIFSYHPKETGWTTHGASYGGKVNATVIGAEYAAAINRARFMQINMRVVGKGARNTMPALRLSGWGALDCTVENLYSRGKSIALEVEPQGVTALAPPELNLTVLNLSATECFAQSVFFRGRPKNSTPSKVVLGKINLDSCERGIYIGEGVHAVTIETLSASRLSKTVSRSALEIRPGSFGHKLGQITGYDLGEGNVLINGTNPTDTGIFNSVIEVDWGKVRVYGSGAVTSGGSSYKTLNVFDRVVNHRDMGIIVGMSSASAISLVVPNTTTEYLPIGSEYTYVQQNTGAITVSAQSGISLFAPSGLTTKGRGSVLRLIKISATNWSVSGDLS